MNNINYFLFLRKKYERILGSLKEITYTYEDLLSSDNATGRYLESEIKEKKIYETKIEETNYIIKSISCLLETECNHSYIDDLIDISPERSQTITYCVICEHTLKT